MILPELTYQTAAKTIQSLNLPTSLPLRPRRIKFVHKMSRGSGANAVLSTLGFQHVRPCAHSCADFHDLYTSDKVCKNKRNSGCMNSRYLRESYKGGARWSIVSSACLILSKVCYPLSQSIESFQIFGNRWNRAWLSVSRYRNILVQSRK